MLYQTLAKAYWEEENLPLFDELIFSWNGKRPERGRFLFYISVKTGAWSPKILYASWGCDGQSTHEEVIDGVSVCQDIVSIEGGQARGFRVDLLAEGGAQLNDLYSFHLFTRTAIQEERGSPLQLHRLEVAGLSQMELPSKRRGDLCSPTSVAAVLRYLLKEGGIDPMEIAEKCYDKRFDIYGNWVLNVAVASSYLGPYWRVWVERLAGFPTLYNWLKRGYPVIVSLRGPLEGSALPYQAGHLVVVTGYDPKGSQVFCMDPAFPDSSRASVSYSFPDFMEAWQRRGQVAYLFQEV